MEIIFSNLPISKASGIEMLLGRKSQRCIVCNNDYVKSCLQGTSQRVGCFVVQYNFQVTDNRTEYELFKQKLDRSSGGGELHLSLQ